MNNINNQYGSGIQTLMVTHNSLPGLKATEQERAMPDAGNLVSYPEILEENLEPPLSKASNNS